MDFFEVKFVEKEKAKQKKKTKMEQVVSHEWEQPNKNMFVVFEDLPYLPLIISREVLLQIIRAVMKNPVEKRLETFAVTDVSVDSAC